MYCNKCNAELTDDALFCHKCGNKVAEQAVQEPCNTAQDSNDITDINLENTPAMASDDPKLSKQKSIKSVVSKFKNLSKKKQIILVCGFVLICAILLIANSDSGSSSSYSDSSYNSGYSSEDYIESLATTALYNELKKRFSYSSYYDLGSTRYSIGTITDSNTEWIVRGRFSLYDYYGKIISRYSDETFTVKINKNTYNTTCTISIK